MIYYLIMFLTIIFLWLSLTVGLNKSTIISFDTNILSYFHQIQSKILDKFFETITWFGSLWVILPLYTIVMFFVAKSGFKNILSLNIMFFGAIATTYSIKYLMDRKRPEIFETIGDLPFDPSFPSAHTTQIAIFTLILGFLLIEFDFTNKLLYLVFLFMIFSFVLISRMYLQVHFFSDIVGGVLIAMIWFLIGLKLYQKGF